MSELPEELSQPKKVRLVEEQRRRDELKWQFDQIQKAKEDQYRRLGTLPPAPIDKLRFWSFMGLLFLTLLGLWFIRP